uniref:Putative ovule protein n=1 Tax=Solanum chacoense TaxID=4108 RepID=A0A0V0I6U4_SOLCH
MISQNEVDIPGTPTGKKAPPMASLHAIVSHQEQGNEIANTKLTTTLENVLIVEDKGEEHNESNLQ